MKSTRKLKLQGKLVLLSFAVAPNLNSAIADPLSLLPSPNGGVHKYLHESVPMLLLGRDERKYYFGGMYVVPIIPLTL